MSGKKATESDQRPDPFGMHKGQSEILGDIVSPIGVEWEVSPYRESLMTQGSPECAVVPSSDK